MRRLLCCLMLLLTLCACGTAQDTEPTPPAEVSPTCAEPTPSPKADGQIATAEARIVAQAEALMHYAKDHPITAELIDRTAHDGRHYALLAVQNDWFEHYFAEYDEEGNITSWVCLSGGGIAGTTGYMPLYTTMDNTKLCFTLIATERTATSPDGTRIEKTRQENDYTAIRFVMADGSTVDAPVSEDGSMAVQSFDEWPAAAIPMAGETPVTAFKMNFNTAQEAATP